MKFFSIRGGCLSLVLIELASAPCRTLVQADSSREYSIGLRYYGGIDEEVLFNSHLMIFSSRKCIQTFRQWPSIGKILHDPQDDHVDCFYFMALYRGKGNADSGNFGLKSLSSRQEERYNH